MKRNPNGKDKTMKQPRRKQKREIRHIFDLTIKYLLQKTSPANTVALVNALFDRRYALDCGVLGTADGIMIAESISRMHKELYGSYPEFQEANMVANLEAEHRRIGLRWAYDREELIKKADQARAESAKTEARIFDLLRQGHTVDEVENLLARERAKETADACRGMPQ